MDLLDQLMAEHLEAEDLLARLKDTDIGPERDELVRQLTTTLRTHMAVEEKFIYPIASDVLGGEPVDEADTEHQLARDGLDKLDELRTEPGFGAAVDMVEAGIAHHVHEEEHQMFPELRREERPQIAALDLDECRQAVADDVIDLTKDELYRRAQEADIPGRSSMSKRELADALAAQ